MQAQLQRVEIETARAGNDDLAIDDAAGRQLRNQLVVQLRKVPIERLQVAALDVDVVAAAKDDGTEAVPFRLIEKGITIRQRVGDLRQHRLDWGLNGGHASIVARRALNFEL